MGHHQPPTTALWSRLLAVILALTVVTAWAETPTIEDLSPEDRAALNQGHAIEVIVEFDQTEAANMAAEHKRLAGLRYEDAAIVAERARSYRRQKERALAALAAEALTIQNDYEYLPLFTARVRSPAALRALLRQDGVKAVHSNIRLRHMLRESLPLIRQPEVIAQGGGGAGATVAVLDTGVDYSKQDFGSCAAPGGVCKVVYAQDFAPDDGALDDNDHGTNVAGIVLGVAPSARIAALDVFRSDGFAYSNDIIDAINWAIANRDTYNIVAMNLSLGGGESSSPCANDLFATPIANARAAGILAAIASGNENLKDALGSPACVPAAVSVGAVYDSAQGNRSWGDCADRPTQADQVTCFSNSASFLTLLAPGSTITAAGISMSGTSQATPHVAGAIAVLRAAYPNESLDATIARLTNTGVPVTDAANGVTKPRIDLFSAFTANRTAYPLTVDKAGAGSGTVSSNPAGINCGNQCQAEFAEGTTVNLTAIPDTGSVFDGWSGACTGTAACAVSMDGARNVTAAFTAVSALSLGEALDNTTLNWNTTGAAGWQGVQLSNRDAARSGAIGDDQRSVLQTSITGPGTLTFQWRVSSELDFDFVEFQVDGVTQFEISGIQGWETRTVTIGAGVHQAQWIYRKDGSVSEGEDAGWVDAVTFTPTQSNQPNLTVTQVISPANGMPGGTIEVSAAVTNQGDVAAGSFWLAFLLSSDAAIAPGDVDTGWGCTFNEGLAGGATNTCSGEIVIPSTLAPGTYYLGAYADFRSEVTESDETNNGLPADNVIAIANSVSSLVVTRTGTGAGKVSSNPVGIDCGSQCNVNFPTGAVVTLTAVPDPGSTFIGWNGDCAASAGSCLITLDTDRNATAIFSTTASAEVFPRNGVWPVGWTTPVTSSVDWSLASDWAEEGRYSLRSGAIRDNQQSQVEISGNFQAGVVSFTFYISSEIDYDWLTFSIDGIEQNGWSGEGQRSVSFPLTAGFHTLRWAYEKDESVALGSDAAWIDSVSLPVVSSGDAATTLITHYYVSILRRQPEPDGLVFWQQLIAEKRAQGLDVKPVFRDMASFFFNSSEYLNRNTSNVEFITNLYLTFFQREPEAGGLTFWLEQLASGVTRNEAMAGFLFSQEFTDFMRALGL
ncbi:MAG: S8 family serine peptidase [Candidatus Competibacteraceae bacterium]|nr:S8 family serine peptidase [Candidatus Competibacteraceae bacterium]